MPRFARVVLIFAVLQIAGTIWLSISALGYGDFPQLLDSARALLAGGDLYSGAATIQGTKNLNPPHLALLMAPLALLPLPAAAAVMWIGIFAAIVLFARAVSKTIPPRYAWTVLAVLLASAPANLAISLINIGWPLAAATAWSWTWLRSGRKRRAVITLGCLASLKLFYLAFVPYWVWRRDWRALVEFTLAFGAVCGLGALVIGWESYIEWAAALRTGSPLSSERPLDASWHSVVARTSATGAAASGAWIAGVLFILIASWLRVRRSQSEAGDWALILTAMLIMSPLGWMYYALIPALPAAVVMLERGQLTAMKILAVGLTIPAAIIVLAADHVSGTIMPAAINSIYALTMTAAWFVLLTDQPSAAALTGGHEQNRLRSP